MSQASGCLAGMCCSRRVALLSARALPSSLLVPARTPTRRAFTSPARTTLGLSRHTTPSCRRKRARQCLHDGCVPRTCGCRSPPRYTRGTVSGARALAGPARGALPEATRMPPASQQQRILRHGPQWAARPPGGAAGLRRRQLPCDRPKGGRAGRGRRLDPRSQEAPSRRPDSCRRSTTGAGPRGRGQLGGGGQRPNNKAKPMSHPVVRSRWLSQTTLVRRRRQTSGRLCLVLQAMPRLPLPPMSRRAVVWLPKGSSPPPGQPAAMLVLHFTDRRCLRQGPPPSPRP